MPFRFLLTFIALLFSAGSNAAIFSFSFDGHIVNGSSDSPLNPGGVGFFGEKYTASISYDTQGAEILYYQDGRYVYRVPSASFEISFPEANLTYSLSTDTESSYLLYEVWNNYSDPYSIGSIGPEDRYDITFVSHQSAVFEFQALDFAFFDGVIDTTLVESGNIPVAISSLLGFDSYQMQYTVFDSESNNFNWLASGVGGEPYVASVPLPPSIWFFGSSLIGLFLRVKDPHLKN